MPCLTNAYKWLQRIVHCGLWRIYTENSHLMHHSQAVRHRALISVCVGSNPTGVVRLTFIVDYHQTVLHFTG